MNLCMHASMHSRIRASTHPCISAQAETRGAEFLLCAGLEFPLGRSRGRMSSPAVLFEKRGHVGVFTLNRPWGIGKYPPSPSDSRHDDSQKAWAQAQGSSPVFPTHPVHEGASLMKFSRPKAMNAINGEVSSQMEAHLDAFEADDDLWVGIQENTNGGNDKGGNKHINNNN